VCSQEKVLVHSFYWFTTESSCYFFICDIVEKCPTHHEGMLCCVQQVFDFSIDLSIDVSMLLPKATSLVFS